MNYDNMCLGSEGLDANPSDARAYRAQTRLCKVCDSWVLTGVPTSMLVPVHEKPYSEAEEARFQQNAAAIIRWEYRRARENGTLISDPYRSHVTALAMARPRAHIRGGTL